MGSISERRNAHYRETLPFTLFVRARSLESGESSCASLEKPVGSQA
jgi:hypothetical protein